MIGRRKGYRVALVMPDNVTNERRQMAALYGAEVIDSPGALGSNGAIALAKHLVAKDDRFVMPYQYGNPAIRAPITRRRVPRSSPTARRSTCSWPASGRAAR